MEVDWDEEEEGGRGGGGGGGDILNRLKKYWTYSRTNPRSIC